MPDDHRPLMPRRNPEDIDLGAIKADVEFPIGSASSKPSHDEGLVKGSHHGASKNLCSCFGIQGPSPSARRGPFPSTVNLTCGRRSWQLHQDPAFGGQGSGRREPFSKAAFQAMVCYGSSTWIRQD